MRIRKLSLHVVIILTLLSIITINITKNKLFYELAIGILSGNIVALSLLILEYQDTRRKTLDSFIFEANYLRAKIANGLNFNFLFGEIFINKEGLIKVDDSSIDNFLKQESNINKLNNLMSSFITLSELSTNNLSFLFNEYHSLFSFKTSNDKTRKLLHDVYFELFNLSNEIKLTSWHFKDQQNYEEINYPAMVHLLFDYVETKYIVKSENCTTLFYEDYLFKFDIQFDKVIILLNPNYKSYDYDIYLSKAVKKHF